MTDQMPKDAQQLWASGGVLGAILASSCCIAPLLLLSLGISGAWIGNLTALEPYKWVFIAIAVVFLGLGFRHVYFRQAEPCEDGTYCARPEANLIVKSALWLATALIGASATVDWWAPLFY
jgi:mercuric ion transport protein